MRRKRTFGHLALILATSLVLGVGSPAVQAKTTTSKLTILKDEKLTYCYFGLGTLRKVTTSNKRVVTARKYLDGALITGKKIGSANVTVTGTNNTMIQKVTVAKKDFTTGCEKLSNNKALVSFKNNTPVFLNSVSVSATFKDVNGKELFTESTHLSDVATGMTAYGVICCPKNVYNKIDYSQTDYSISYDRTLGVSYKEYNKVTFTETKKSNKVVVKAKTKYKGSGSINVYYDVKFYNKKGKLIDFAEYSNILSKEDNTRTIKIAIPTNATSYKIVKRVILGEF